MAFKQAGWSPFTKPNDDSNDKDPNLEGYRELIVNKYMQFDDDDNMIFDVNDPAYEAAREKYPYNPDFDYVDALSNAPKETKGGATDYEEVSK